MGVIEVPIRQKDSKEQFQYVDFRFYKYWKRGEAVPLIDASQLPCNQSYEIFSIDGAEIASDLPEVLTEGISYFVKVPVGKERDSRVNS